MVLRKTTLPAVELLASAAQPRQVVKNVTFGSETLTLQNLEMETLCIVLQREAGGTAELLELWECVKSVTAFCH